MSVMAMLRQQTSQIDESGMERNWGFCRIQQSRMAMRALKVSLIASLIGTAVGLGSWVFGIGQIIWPAHPQFACFLLTLVATIVIQITWPRLTETNSQ